MEKTISSRRVFDGRLLKIRVDEVELPNGRVTSREIVEHPGAVAIVALDPNGNLLLVRQYRNGPNEELLEIPAGTREQGEGVEDCVRRELQEETGYRPANVERLGGFYTTPGYTTEFIEIYLAIDLSFEPIPRPEDEQIEVERVPLESMLEMIKAGEIRDGKSIAAMTLYRLRG
jgi:ADP-ribose pyrophosphatase